MLVYLFGNCVFVSYMRTQYIGGIDEGNMIIGISISELRVAIGTYSG